MKFKMATIGVSHGGLQALEVIFSGLPANLLIAIATERKMTNKTRPNRLLTPTINHYEIHTKSQHTFSR